jgi:hypothetical protein
VREFRRRDRRGYQFEIDELSEELHLIREDFADFKRWAFMMHAGARSWRRSREPASTTTTGAGRS